MARRTSSHPRWSQIYYYYCYYYYYHVTTCSGFQFSSENLRIVSEFCLFICCFCFVLFLSDKSSDYSSEYRCLKVMPTPLFHLFTHARTHAHTQTHTCARANARAHARTNTHAHIHTHTQIRTQLMLSLSNQTL